MASLDKTARLRVGVIGAGFISQVTHLPCFAAEPDAQLVALADNRPELLAQVGRFFDISRQYPHHDALIEDADIDAVVVCVHRRCLAPIVEAALSRGKAVLSEKPMAYTVAQGETLLAACAADQIYAVGYMKRYDPGVRMFRDLLAARRADGSLGAMRHVAIRDFCPTYAVTPPNHFATNLPKSYRYIEWPSIPEHLPLDYQSDYDWTLNVFSHDINLARWLLDCDIAAAGFFVRRGSAQTAVLSAAAVDIVVQGGRSDGGGWDQSVEVLFERGRLVLRLVSPLDRSAVASIEIHRPDGSQHVTVPADKKVWAFQAQAAHFIAAARGDVSLETPGRDSLHDLAVIEELWKRIIWKR